MPKCPKGKTGFDATLHLMSYNTKKGMPKKRPQKRDFRGRASILLRRDVVKVTKIAEITGSVVPEWRQPKLNVVAG